MCIFAFSGCGMTNDEIIKGTKKCNDNGLDVDVVKNGFNLDTEKIICTPRIKND